MGLIETGERIARNAWRVPVLGRIRAWDYARSFARMPPNRFRGVYASCAEAERAIPAGARVGYDHVELGGMYRLRMEKACQSDYAVLFWLRQLVDADTRLFDFAGLAPTEVASERVGQGLVQCSMTTCSYDHPLIRGVLLQFLPVPDGIDEGEFYSCLSCYEGLIDANAWDAAAFAQAIEERIVAPGAHAVAILDAWPTLTRLYTTISPQEMTEDPFFHENASLPAVDLTSQVATRTVTCEGGSSWSLPGGWSRRRSIPTTRRG